jgi:nucleotide-binding universal stress UspA family protein
MPTRLRAAPGGSGNARIHALPYGIVAIDAEERVEAGEPSRVIDAVAEEEDAAMIVVGTHARGALEGAAHGSVSSRLAASASRPVLLVRADNLRPFG